tara:strand:+ start:493 stop:660 length:168 start_codon:yes stop_codon:yes gene_type:complete
VVAVEVHQDLEVEQEQLVLAELVQLVVLQEALVQQTEVAAVVEVDLEMVEMVVQV